MRLSFTFFLVNLLILGFSFSYFPFSGEDARTIGRRWGFELENDFTYFRYYSGSYHQDYIFQLAVGVNKNLDVALFVPYSKFYDGRKVEGLNDVGLFAKHILLWKWFRTGYKVQVHFDTGRDGIGYGKTTANLNLMGEVERNGIVYNLNLIYIKSGHVEELRDSYGFVFGIFTNGKGSIDIGIELSVLQPEDSKVGVLNIHLLTGLSYHINGGTDFNVGIHKTLTRHQSFVDYGVLAGVKVSF